MYANTTMLTGDARENVATLKSEVQGHIMIMGSGELIRTLLPTGLIDEYALQIFPIVLGSGTTIFGPGERLDLELTHSVATTTGVIIAQYTARR